MSWQVQDQNDRMVLRRASDVHRDVADPRTAVRKDGAFAVSASPSKDLQVGV